MLLWLLSGLLACAPALSTRSRSYSVSDIPFTVLLPQPSRYEGQRLILGGYIIETLNTPQGSTLKILQAPLNYWNEPRSRDLSQGRFLIQSRRFLDPEIYKGGRKITVLGQVLGSETEELGERTYTYPVLQEQGLHLWPREVRRLRPYYPYDRYHYGYPHFFHPWRRPYWYW